MSDDKRNETQLICDILGLESLVDEISSKLLHRQGSNATPSAVLGPFYRAHAPFLDNGSSIVKLDPSSTWYRLNDLDNHTTHLSGRVLSASTQRPIPNAIVDIWEAAPNGLYEQQVSILG
jgi:catechol 1,2-dioxygenase